MNKDTLPHFAKEGLIKILLVEDNPGDAKLFEEYLGEIQNGTRYKLISRGTLKDAMSYLEEKSCDIILLDPSLPDSAGIKSFLSIHVKHSQIPIILLTGLTDEEFSVKCVNAGAQDYINKNDLNPALLARTIKYALERNKINEELSGNAAEWQKTFDAIDDMIIIIDKNRKILRANKTAKAAYPEQDLVGQFCYKLIHGTDSPPESCLCNRVFEDNKPVRHDRVTNVENDKVMDVSLYPMTEGKPSDRFIHIIRDMTTEKKLEDQLRQSEKMQAIGQLAGGVAHDFNNQLTPILGYAGIMKREFKDNPEIVNYLDIIIQATKRATALTQQLLTFSRKKVVEHSPVNIHKIINEVVQLLKHTLDKRIQVILNLNANDDCIMGSIDELQNALLNLAINSRDAMKNGGDIIFTTRNRFMDIEVVSTESIDLESGNYLEIEVRDTGPGIPAEILPRIFEPFFTTKEKSKGTGLGLAAVYGTIQSHGGNIKVYSVPGKGTEFKILVPLKTISESAEKSDTVDLEPLEGEPLIFLVDDEDVIRNVAIKMLRILGCRIVDYANPKDALDYYRNFSKKFELVIFDLNMPTMSGLQLFTEMKKINPKIKAIIASGYSSGKDIDEVLAAGALDQVNKPFELQQLSDAVNKILGNKKERN